MVCTFFYIYVINEYKMVNLLRMIMFMFGCIQKLYSNIENEN